MGPNPVNVIDTPAALFRLILKYVLSASENEAVASPLPVAKIMLYSNFAF